MNAPENIVSDVFLTEQGGRQANAVVEVDGHANATLSHRVVSGQVRRDVDWLPAIQDALKTIFTPGCELQDAANAVDGAMMRAIHAGARMDAVHDLGVQAIDSTDPAVRERWEEEGAPAAAARVAEFNRDQAARGQEE